jgi:hypothetical protein
MWRLNPSSLALSGALAVLSWRGVANVLGEGRADARWIMLALRSVAPLAIAVLVGAATFHLPLALVVGVAAAGVRAWSKRRATTDSQAA